MIRFDSLAEKLASLALPLGAVFVWVACGGVDPSSEVVVDELGETDAWLLLLPELGEFPGTDPGHPYYDPHLAYLLTKPVAESDPSGGSLYGPINPMGESTGMNPGLAFYEPERVTLEPMPGTTSDPMDVSTFEPIDPLPMDSEGDPKLIFVDPDPSQAYPGIYDVSNPVDGPWPWGERPQPSDYPPSLWAALEKDGRPDFMDLVRRAGLVELFESEGAQFTLLLHSEAALQRWDGLAMLELPQNEALLRAAILHHLVVGQHRWSEFPSDMMDTALPYQPVRIMVGDGRVFSTTDAEAQLTDLRNRTTLESMIHEVDTVLMPVLTAQVMLERTGYGLFHTLLEVTDMLGFISDPDTRVTVLAISDGDLRAQGFDLDVILDPAMRLELEVVAVNHILLGATQPLDGADVETLSGLRVQGVGEGRLVFENGETLNTEFVTTAGNGVVYEVDAIVTHTR